MIAVLDVNIIAGRKLAGALAQKIQGVVRYNVRGLGQAREADAGAMSLVLPPSWAGKLAWLAMPMALRAVTRQARARGGKIETIIVSVPQYLPLARAARSNADILYYCTDDFRGYAGWNPAKVARDEGALCRLAAVSIFVSDALRRRAIQEYGLDPLKTLTLPNASERRFAEPSVPPPAIAALRTPVLGVAGVFNRRIDFDFLAACAEHSGVGSVALVGPIEEDLFDDPSFQRFVAMNKVRCFGRQPHDDLHRWMAAFDVAVIPYAPTEFNHYCSPMRLYDHLAIGHPILATRHCDQVTDRSEVIVADMDDISERIDEALVAAATGRSPALETWSDRADVLLAFSGPERLFPD